jgi:hypothetical protein
MHCFTANEKSTLKKSASERPDNLEEGFTKDFLNFLETAKKVHV